MWRDGENNQPIDASGVLVTGESFQGIGDLKKIIVGQRRLDFYRCLTQKLLIYALGRGLAYYDEHTVDEIVSRLEEQGGRFGGLLMEIVQSAPFQRRHMSSRETGPADRGDTGP
jgi:hypothetical protein